MFQFRRAALRLISHPSAPIIARPRTISSFATVPLRTKKQASSLFLQKRWASDEAKKEEVPISQLQPTPQEEVENAVLGDSAASTEPTQASESADSSATNINATETVRRVESIHRGSSASRSTDASYERAPYATEGGHRTAPNPPKTSVYIGNLFFDVTEEDLQKELARFGTVQEIKLIRDARGLSKGFGYATFSSIPEATRACEALNNQLYEGRRMHVNFARNDKPMQVPRPTPGNRPENPPSRTLFIGNMSWEMNDRDLNSLFKPLHGLIDVRVAVDRRTGQPRGFAHADFTDVKFAMEGKKYLESQEPYGRNLRVDYSYSNNAPRNQAREGDL